MIMKAWFSAAAVAAFASLASFATAANATLLADTMTSGKNAHALGPRDPYTDGAKASRFDVYSDAAKVTDPRDPYTDGAHG
jgi:hypothetical protein